MKTTLRRKATMTVLVRAADRLRPDGTRRRARIAVEIDSPEWVSAVGPAGTVKKEFTAHLHGHQIGRLLLYREADGTFDISGIGVQDIHQGCGVASQLLDYAFRETGADHFTLSTGTTGDGTVLVAAYGEGRRGGRRVVERPTRLGGAVPAPASDGFTDCLLEQDGETERADAPR